MSVAAMTMDDQRPLMNSYDKMPPTKYEQNLNILNSSQNSGVSGGPASPTPSGLEDTSSHHHHHHHPHHHHHQEQQHLQQHQQLQQQQQQQQHAAAVAEAVAAAEQRQRLLEGILHILVHCYLIRDLICIIPPIYIHTRFKLKNHDLKCQLCVNCIKESTKENLVYLVYFSPLHLGFCAIEFVYEKHSEKNSTYIIM